jgi:hypothetical protein
LCNFLLSPVTSSLCGPNILLRTVLKHLCDIVNTDRYTFKATALTMEAVSISETSVNFYQATYTTSQKTSSYSPYKLINKGRTNYSLNG